MTAVAWQTWRQLWRDRRLPIAAVALAVLLLAAIGLDARRTADWERARRAAQAADDRTFDTQGARNPHSVAHFSRFAFRPRLAINALDPGVSDYAGTAVWMQAHSRDPANARPAEDQLELGRGTALELAWIWQVLAPLVLIALGFDAISRERERRSLALLLIGGRSLAGVVVAKAAALWALIAGGVMSSALLALLMARGEPVPDAGARLTWWLGGVLIYLTFWVVIVMAVSTWVRSSRAALAGLLALWTGLTLIAPRLIATAADERWPATTGADLRADIQRDREQGFDGHGGAGAREQAFRAKVLAAYRVATIEELPVSFAGLALDEDERVGNLIFDKHYAALADRYRRQHAWRRWATVLSPVPALQHVTMTAAASSLGDHLAFTAQAEALRRQIVAMLNADLIANGKALGFDYQAPPALWATIPSFTYQPARLRPRDLVPELGALVAWLLASGLALGLAVRRTSRRVMA